jgi:hypothetical protein
MSEICTAGTYYWQVYGLVESGATKVAGPPISKSRPSQILLSHPPFSPEPRGMHRKPYHRLYRAHHVAGGRWLTAVTAKLGTRRTLSRRGRAALGSKA